MKRALKCLLMTIGVLLLVIVAAACLVLPKMAFPWLSHEIKERSGYRLAAGSVGFHLWKGISLQQVSLKDPQEKEVFSAEQFYLDPHWPDLLKKRLSINTISMDLAGGHIEGRGKIHFADGVQYQLKLKTDRFEVVQASKTLGYVSGDVQVAGDMKAPRAIDAKGAVEFRQRHSQNPPQGQVHLHLEKGQGEVRGYLTVPLQAHVTAQLDLVQERIDMNFQTGAYAWNPKVAKPWDLTLSQGKISGTLTEGARVRAFALFQSSASIQYRGVVSRNEAGTRIRWEELILHPPRGADWHSEKPGYALITSQQLLRIPELALTDNVSRVRLSQLQHSPKYTEGTLRADVVLGFLVDMVPGLKMDKDARATADVRVRGRWPQILIEGNAATQIPRMEYETAGVDIQDLNVELEGKENNLAVKTFTGKLGKGTFLLVGKAWPVMDLKWAARKVTFGDPQELDLTTDANLELTGDAQAPVLTGSIRPREGTYTAAKKDKKKETSTQEPSAFWKALRIDLHAEWSHRLWYRDGLTKIETAGDLRVRKEQGAEGAALTGPISLLRGSYDAYGRDFRIDTGDIIFTGGAEINPRLNIRAQYRAADYDIGLLVLGTAQRPELNFTSSPPLSQQEILSVLVTGRPSGTLGTGSASATGEIAADVASTYLTKTLRSSGLNLGLDVVRVTPTPTGTMWTVGRYVGPDLFVSYGQNPKDSASSVVNAEYFLTRRWSISTQASSVNDNYVDFLFRYPLKKKSQP